MGSSPPTSRSYKKYFKQDRNILNLFWASTLTQLKRTPRAFIFSHLVAVIIPFVYLLLFDQQASLFKTVCGLTSTILTYSATFLGFMTIAFSLLVTFANKKLSMWLFCSDDNEYSMPPIRFLLLFFCYPISLMLLLVLTTLSIFIISILPVDSYALGNSRLFVMFRIDIEGLQLIVNRSSIFIIIWITALASMELPSFIGNIYKFMVLYFGKFSEIQENEIIYKIINKTPLDDYERRFEAEIISSSEDSDEPDK